MASPSPSTSSGQTPSNTTLLATNHSALAVPSTLNHLSVVICVVSSLLGLVGNGLVVWVTSCRMRQTVNTVWFLSLALADLLYALLLPFYATKFTMNNQWIFGSELCKAVSSLLFLSMFASVFQLTLISADRCLLVSQPIWAQRLRTPGRAWGVAAGAWLLAGAFSAPYLALRELKDRNGKYFCIVNFGAETVRVRRQKAMIVVRFVAGFLVPLLVISACHVAVALRAGQKGRRPSRTAKVVTAVVVSFFVCWLPYHFFNFLHGWGGRHWKQALAVASSLAFSLTCLGCFLNPLLYTFLGRRFQEGLRGCGRIRWLEAALAEDSVGSSRRRKRSLGSTTSSEQRMMQP
ncbi:prostaglandin D2 receptor 2-like [Carettochelys insculpta]|uniref:prostaglandin D2 receptor 2-like n=1 Tax=Carettochelys insculpta TaxID=44489 RepID=UPI003EB93928